MNPQAFARPDRRRQSGDWKGRQPSSDRRGPEGQ